MQKIKTSAVVAVSSLVAFLGLSAGTASADFAIAGEWYGNRGPTVNIPIGQFDGPCAAGTPFNVGFDGGAPITAMNYVNAPCVRHNDAGFTLTPLPSVPSYMIVVPDVGLAVIPQSGVPASSQTFVNATAPPVGKGDTFVVPPGIFARNQASTAPVPANPVVQQLDTLFDFNAPNTLRTPSPLAQGKQLAGIATQTRKLQKSAWNGPGQLPRAVKNFNHSLFSTVGGPGATAGSAAQLSRRVSYTNSDPNAFGGTMSMLLNGTGTVYVVTDLVTLLPGNEVLLSPVGDGMDATVHMGRGYETTQRRNAADGLIFPTFNIPLACATAVPPSPTGCDFITGIINNDPFFLGQTTMQPIGVNPGATTVNTGFPWTTGHVSAYAKGAIQGVPQTSTLTAQGSDTVIGPVRTIQLVAGGVALRNAPASGFGRTPHIEIVTITVPEPGSTMALVGALGLIGGLYGVRRRFF